MQISKLRQIIETIFHGKTTSSSMSSNEVLVEHRPKPQPVQFSTKIDAKDGHRRPDGDGWVRDRGGWVRKIQCGSRPAMGSEITEDDEPAQPRSRIMNPFNPFRHGRYFDDTRGE